MTAERIHAFDEDDIVDTLKTIALNPQALGFEIPNMAIYFALKQGSPLSSQDIDFIAEIGPLVYQRFFNYLANFTVENAISQIQYDALSANYLSTLQEIALMIEDQSLSKEFDNLVTQIKSRQSQHGQALTDYILERTGKIDSK